jgi:hypothetical protein
MLLGGNKKMGYIGKYILGLGLIGGSVTPLVRSAGNFIDMAQLENPAPQISTSLEEGIVAEDVGPISESQYTEFRNYMHEREELFSEGVAEGLLGTGTFLTGFMLFLTGSNRMREEDVYDRLGINPMYLQLLETQESVDSGV